MRRALPVAVAVMLSGMMAAPFLPSVTSPPAALAAIISKVPDMRKNEAQQAISRAIQEADSLASRATFYGLGNAEVSAEFESILRRMNRNGSAPEWSRQYVRGYWRAVRESWWRGELESVVMSPDGTRYSTHNRPDAGCEPFPASAYGAPRTDPESAWYQWHKWPSLAVWRSRPDNPRRAGAIFATFDNSGVP
jgi:hypothetical protein